MTPETSSDSEITARQSAMKVLALADENALEMAYNNFKNRPDWQFTRKPETGLIMARGRMGGGGAPFNIGEVSVTRATVTLASGETGHAYCHGRNQRKAAIAAFFDAAWQNPALRPRIESEIIAPLTQHIKADDSRKSRETAATKVDFFTLVRGDN